VGTRRTGIDQLLADPFVAHFLGSSGNEVLASAAELRPSRFGELSQLSWLSRDGLEIVTQAAGRRDFVSPIHIEREAVLREQLLLGLTLMRAGHIRGRHRNQVSARARCRHGFTDSGRPQKVDLDGLSQRGIKGNGGGRVNDHVGSGQRGPSFVVKPQAVLTDVTGHGPHPPSHLGGKSIAQFGPQTVKTVILDDFTSQTGGCIGPATRSHQDGYFSLGNAAQDAFYQRSAQNPVAPVIKKRFARRSRPMAIGNV